MGNDLSEESCGLFVDIIPALVWIDKGKSLNTSSKKKCNSIQTQTVYSQIRVAREGCIGVVVDFVIISFVFWALYENVLSEVFYVTVFRIQHFFIRLLFLPCSSFVQQFDVY